METPTVLRGGVREVEQTLRLARDDIERDIARYRSWLFGPVVATTVVVRLIDPGGPWIPTFFFMGAWVYAWIARIVVERLGARPWLSYLTLVCDLALNCGNFLLMARVSAGSNSENVAFTTHVLAPALLFVLLINSLRYGRASSVVGSVSASALYLLVMGSLTGFHPAQLPVVVILVLTGPIGFAAASQARRNLDRFARLQLLRRYLPPAAVERVLREDPDAAMSLGGKLETVTLLAADLRGFTAMSEKLEPSQVVEQLNAYHGAMIDVIDRHGGAIDKFIGDGTLVVFGLGVSPEAGARAAVACAREMLAALDLHNVERTSRAMPALRMGVGVHTGQVIAGNIGVPGRRLEFTVIGDAVNTAARLEGETKNAGTPVLVSAETAAHVGDGAALRELSPVSIRGREMPLKVFALASVDAPGREDGVAAGLAVPS
jgi:class 3 adenylate cyclase